MNTRRLLILADFLESIPENYTFHLSTWGTDDEDRFDEEDDTAHRMAEILTPSHKVTKDDAEFLFVDCGYSACAVGHACLSHKLRAEGLSYFIDDEHEMAPLFGELKRWDAVREFFDLEEEEAYEFFIDERYVTGNVTAKNVATKIRVTVA